MQFLCKIVKSVLYPLLKVLLFLCFTCVLRSVFDGYLE